MRGANDFNELRATGHGEVEIHGTTPVESDDQNDHPQWKDRRVLASADKSANDERGGFAGSSLIGAARLATAAGLRGGTQRGARTPTR